MKAKQNIFFFQFKIYNVRNVRNATKTKQLLLIETM